MSAPAPIIVTALLGPQDQAHFDALRRRWFPAQLNHLDAHLTLFHHLPPSVAAELKHRLIEETRGIRPPGARVSSVISLGRGVAYRIEAPGLVAIRSRLAEAFAGLLVPQDLAAWRPHITIQNKVAPPDAAALLRELQADFRPHPMKIAALASWWYRGGPWEPLSRHMFA